jgi:glutamate synthase (NADPH/NADH) small chain
MSNTPAHPVTAKRAWCDVERAGLPARSAADRLADFLEIYGPYDEATAREQASRCLACPEPACVAGCPLGNRIPEWMQLTAEGHFLEAAAVSCSTSNLPELCARLCAQDHLCEGACILNGKAEPVSIGAIEQFIQEYAFAHGAADATVLPPNGRRVAVAGAGPGGLACADELARRGYTVTVFDAGLVPGGLLVDGIPAFKLEKSIVQRRVEILRKRGVAFRLGVTVGRDVTLGELHASFDAVYLALAARQARPLHLPGADLPGVVQALPFIAQKNADLSLETSSIDVAGKRVLVVGGGDTAMDCLRTALRSGAREAVGVYRRDEASLPCSRRDFTNAVEEGARFVFQAAPVAVLGDGSGRVSALRVARTEPGAVEESGRRAFAPVPGTEFDLPADFVLLALGFDPLPFRHWAEYSAQETGAGGVIRVDDQQMTGVAGVFAGGDLVRGPCLVAHTCRDGRKAALGIDRYLTARKPAGPLAVGVPTARA